MEKILKILEENARISLEDIATMVESTPEEVAKQIDAYTSRPTSSTAIRR